MIATSFLACDQPCSQTDSLHHSRPEPSLKAAPNHPSSRDPIAFSCYNTTKRVVRQPKRTPRSVRCAHLASGEPGSLPTPVVPPSQLSAGARVGNAQGSHGKPTQNMGWLVLVGIGPPKMVLRWSSWLLPKTTQKWGVPEVKTQTDPLGGCPQLTNHTQTGSLPGTDKLFKVMRDAGARARPSPRFCPRRSFALTFSVGPPSPHPSIKGGSPWPTNRPVPGLGQKKHNTKTLSAGSPCPAKTGGIRFWPWALAPPDPRPGAGRPGIGSGPSLAPMGLP